VIRLSGPAQPREATVRDLATAEAVALDWRPWFRSENVGLLLTLGYLFLTTLGVFHRALAFLVFRINVFDYAEPSDFLLAALRDPLIILVCIAPLPLLALYYKGAAWLQRRTKSTWLSSTERQKEFTRRYRRPLYAFTAVLWAIAVSLHEASSVARDLREHRAPSGGPAQDQCAAACSARGALTRWRGIVARTRSLDPETRWSGWQGVRQKRVRPNRDTTSVSAERPRRATSVRFAAP
jgi:hypothetical protein